MDSKDEKTDWTKKVAIFISLLSLGAFIWSAWTNQRLIRYQQKWQETTRRNEITPDIQLTSETGFDSTYDGVTIVFENISKSIAQDIFLLIGDSRKISRLTFHDFVPHGGGSMQNYIKPGEKLKCSFPASMMFGDEYSNKFLEEKGHIARPSEWTFYFSYFDVDRNEYLVTITEHPAGVGGDINVWTLTQRTPLDSLLLSLPRSKKAIYKDIHIRDLTEGEYPWIRKSLTQ